MSQDIGYRWGRAGYCKKCTKYLFENEIVVFSKLKSSRFRCFYCHSPVRLKPRRRKRMSRNFKWVDVDEDLGST